MYNYMYGYDLFNPFHFLYSVICFIVVFVIVMWLIRMIRGKGHYMHGHGFYHDSGMNILREKYAKGEITKEEYHAKKKDLMS